MKYSFDSTKSGVDIMQLTQQVIAIGYQAMDGNRMISQVLGKLSEEYV